MRVLKSALRERDYTALREIDAARSRPVRGSNSAEVSRLSDLRIEIKEGFQARAQLLFNLFLAAFEDVHGHMGLTTVGELYRGFTDLGNIFRRQEPHAVNQCQIRHK